MNVGINYIIETKRFGVPLTVKGKSKYLKKLKKYFFELLHVIFDEE